MRQRFRKKPKPLAVEVVFTDDNAAIKVTGFHNILMYGHCPIVGVDAPGANRNEATLNAYVKMTEGLERILMLVKHEHWKEKQRQGIGPRQRIINSVTSVSETIYQ